MATLRVTNLRGRSANIAPDLPDGANITGIATVTDLNVTGVCTATSFVGSGAALTGIDATSIKDSGDTVRVQANTSGIEVTGVSTFSSHATVEGNIYTAGNLNLTADKKIRIGTGEDLVIQHDGNNSIIDSTTGNTYIRNTSAQFIFQAKMDENSLILKPDGAVEAYHDSNKKLETSATGITVTGTVAATSYTGDGSALTGIEAGVTTTSQYNQSGVITINLGTGQGHEVTLAAGISTITVTGGTAGASHHLILTQPSSGITTVGFSTYFLWPSGSPPNLSRSSASSETDMITFVVKQQTQTGTGVTQLLASAGLDYQ